MSNSNDNGCFGIVAIIIYAISWIGTGVLAWKWTSPETFSGALVFLVVWIILGYIAQMIGGLIIVALSNSQD